MQLRDDLIVEELGFAGISYVDSPPSNSDYSQNLMGRFRARGQLGRMTAPSIMPVASCETARLRFPKGPRTQIIGI